MIDSSDVCETLVAIGVAVESRLDWVSFVGAFGSIHQWYRVQTAKHDSESLLYIRMMLLEQDGLRILIKDAVYGEVPIYRVHVFNLFDCDFIDRVCELLDSELVCFRSRFGGVCA